MEESEKRRERLRAMRMEAAQADVGNYAETSLPNHLSNPLVESTMLEQSEPCTAPRFDYYTNPMSAFSATKKRGSFDNHTVSDNYVPSHHNNSPATYVPSNFPGLRNPEMSPSPTHQFHQHSPDQRMFHARGFSGSGCHGGPAMPRPFPMDQGTPGICSGPRSNHFPGHPPRGMSSPGSPFVNHFPGHPPRGMSSPGSPFVNHFPGHPPRGMSSPGSPFVNHFPSHPPREMSSPSIVPGPRGNNYTSPTQERVNYYSPNPSSGHEGTPSPGQGSHGHRGSMTPTSRFGSGRGSGSHGRHFSLNKSPRPEHFPFYNESMLDDPWKALQPGIWRTIASLSSPANRSQSWISKSRMKKARVSEPSGRSSSQPSLAEYLAASFNEAVNDAPSV